MTPPHFHAYYGEFSATILIETLEIGEGRLPRRAFEDIEAVADLVAWGCFGDAVNEWIEGVE